MIMERIDQRDIVHQGRKLTVVIVRDDHASPMEAECYLPEDIAAWKRDDWQYVGVLINEGDQHIDSLWGVEYGRLSTVDIGIDRIVSQHPVPDMLASLPPVVREIEPARFHEDEHPEVTAMRIQHAGWERMWLRRYIGDQTVSDIDLMYAFDDMSYRLSRRLARLHAARHPREID